jgi:hypothetical protein
MMFMQSTRSPLVANDFNGLMGDYILQCYCIAIASISQHFDAKHVAAACSTVYLDPSHGQEESENSLEHLGCPEAAVGHGPQWVPLLTVMSVSFRTRQFDRAPLVLRPPKRNPPQGVLLRLREKGRESFD